MQGSPHVFAHILVLAVILYVFGSIRVLRQYERGVVFLLGKFEGVRGARLTLVFVPVQQMVRVSLRTVTMQIPSRKIITKDNVSIDIAAVAYYHISDPEKAVIAIENVYNAINQISQTTVRNVVGRFSLDQLLSDTASINEQIKNVIDGHTEPVGYVSDGSRDQRHYSARQLERDCCARHIPDDQFHVRRQRRAWGIGRKHYTDVRSLACVQRIWSV